MIGTDPEFFLKRDDGKYINAEHHFPGSKEEPFVLENGAGLQTDNVAVEFASAPAKTMVEFVASIETTIKHIQKMLPPKHTIDIKSSVEFDDQELNTDQARLFGCSPSYDAWKLVMNEPPSADETNLRSIGGHIHVGFDEGSGNDFLLEPYGKIDTIKVMDCLHGITSIILDSDEAAAKRRELYGKAGDHRPTEYGVEYRTLSSFWLKTPTLVKFVYALTEDALKIMREKKNEELITKINSYGKEVPDIINTNDYDLASKVTEEVLPDYISNETLELYRKAMVDMKKEVNVLEAWV